MLHEALAPVVVALLATAVPVFAQEQTGRLFAHEGGWDRREYLWHSADAFAESNA